MSKTRFPVSLTRAINELNTVVAEQRNIVSGDVVKGTYSQESVGEFITHFEDQTRDITHQVSEVMRSLDPEGAASLEGNTEALRAGVIAAMASSNASEYHTAALSSMSREGSISLEGLFSGLGGEIHAAEDGAYSQESFDTTQLANFAAQSIAYNVLAARQDSFSEAFFPTKVIAPSEGGLSIEVDKQEVLDYMYHDKPGVSRGDKRHNLVNAFADHNILNVEATELVPYALPDNSTDKFFVDSGVVATANREIMGESVATRPLKLGKAINLLSLSSHPGLIDNGVLDITDQIAPGMALNKLYMQLTETGTPDTIEVIPFNVSRMTRTQFKKSAEGSGREVTLNFITDSLTLGADTKTIAGVNTNLLKTVVADANVTATLRVSVTGSGNLDTGSITVSATDIEVDGVYDADGGSLSLTAGAGKAVVDRLEALAANFIGFDLSARRSNSNWRSTGAIIDVTPHKETYAIVPGYPISVLSAAGANAEGSKISGMVNAARIRNSNNAVTMLLNYAEQLEAAKESIQKGVKVDLIGAARHLVTPFYGSETIDVAARISSISSHERAMDVARVLVDAIRNHAYKMYRDANYGPALAIASSGTADKPKVLIGCDAVIERHLNIIADARLMGEHMDYEVVSTNDRRMTGKIVLTFTRNRPGSDDLLSFGVHAYVPELIQRVNVSRGGQTHQQDRVIPRSIHVPVLPVMSVLEVTNLEEALGNTGA